MKKKPTELGMNRTGRDLSPLDSEKMRENSQEGISVSSGDESDLARMRSLSISEAEPLGNVPPPGTAKGMAKSALDALKGKKPNVFIDKLSERLAFERSGSRFYQALITKCEALNESNGNPSLDDLRMIQEEEMRHFNMLWRHMEALGADPTVQTPSADLVGVESMGIMQAVSDSRTTVPQSLHAILGAELIDNEGWQDNVGFVSQK